MQAEHEIEHKVLGTIASLCKRTPDALKLNDSLTNDLGVDSIQFLELLAVLEEIFSLELDVDDLRPELFRTIRSVIHFVEKRVG